MLKIALDKWYHTSVIKLNILKALVFQPPFHRAEEILVN